MAKEYSTTVITEHGATPMRELTPGSYVFNAFDGHPMKVFAVQRMSPQTGYKVTYSDGRVAIYLESHRIAYKSNRTSKGSPYYVGRMSTVMDWVSKDMNLPKDDNGVKLFDSIIQHHINWKSPIDGVTIGASIDPYLAGPLLIYGNRNSPYINLPSNLPGINSQSTYFEYFGHSNMVEELEVYNEEIRFIDYEGREITWEALFGEELACQIQYSTSIIPNRFMYGSVEDRWQFIRGVFDCGYNKDCFDKEIGILARDHNVLLSFNRMLLSLGIIGMSTFDPVLDKTAGMGIVLHIMTKVTPEFFYNRKDIIDIINSDNVLYPKKEEFDLCIVNITKLPGEYASYDILLDEENRGECYLTANMLPRASMMFPIGG